MSQAQIARQGLYGVGNCQKSRFMHVNNYNIYIYIYIYIHTHTVYILQFCQFLCIGKYTL